MPEHDETRSGLRDTTPADAPPEFDARLLRQAADAQEMLRGRVPDEVIEAALSVIGERLADRAGYDEPTPPVRPIIGASVPTIGRDDEFARMRQAYTDVVETGRVRVVNLVGEAGIGKTRLLDDLEAWVLERPDEPLILRARAESESRSMAHGLVRSLVAGHLNVSNDATTAELSSKLIAGLASLEPVQAEAVGHWLGFDLSRVTAVRDAADNTEFGAIARGHLISYLRSVVAGRPVVLVLEDLQWADAETLDVLGHIVDELAHTPLLVLCATRPSLFDDRPAWSAGPAGTTTTVDLGPLDGHARRQHGQELLRFVDGDIGKAVGLVETHARGNPLHAVQMVALLVDVGVVSATHGVWRLDEAELQAHEPSSEFTQVIRDRLDTLSERELIVLRRAAFVGRRFWDDALVALAAADGREPGTHAEVASVLSWLAGRGLVLPQDRSLYTGCREYTFAHQVVCEVTAEYTPADERAAAHRSVADWLARRSAEREAERAGILAEHLALGGALTRAADLFHEAGARSSTTGASQSAVLFYERSLECREMTGTDAGLAATSTRIEAAHLLGTLGRNDEAAAMYRIAVEDATRSDSRRLAASAMAGELRTVAARGDWGAAPELIDRARPPAERFGGDILGRFLSGHALWLIDGPEQDLAAAQRDLERALRIWRELDDPAAEVRTLNELGLLNRKAGRHAEADRWYAAGLAVARRVGDTKGEWMLLQNQAVLAHLDARAGRGDYARVVQRYRSSLDQRRRLGLPYSLSLANLAQAEVEAGHLEDGRSHATDALRAGWERHDPLDWTIAVIAFAQIAFVENRLDDGAGILRSLLAVRRTPSVEGEIAAVLEYHAVDPRIVGPADESQDRALVDVVDELLAQEH